MKRKLHLQWFIEQHSDWEKILSEKPYCLSITRDVVCGQNLIMFKYSQIDSDMSLPLVKECRGIVLNEDTFDVVSCGFFKFFNYGEPHADVIDWKSATILEKVDGSLIKIVRIGRQLLISTNGTIDAFKAPITEQIGCRFKSFGDIVDSILKAKNITVNDFDENFTYMFELVSPYTRVVIPYEIPELYFIGIRDNRSLIEEKLFLHSFAKLFKIPKQYSASTVEECIEMARVLPWDEEGYVVVDKDFNRVKIKSPAWLGVHHLKGENGVMSIKRAIDIVRANEIDEICSYFEEFRNALIECKERFYTKLKDIEQRWIKFLEAEDNNLFSSRKDQALYIQKEFREFSGIAFALLDQKIDTVKEWFFLQPADKIAKALGYKE